MNKKEVRILVVIENAEQIPGWGYDPQDYVRMIQKNLDNQIPHYEPKVMLDSAS